MTRQVVHCPVAVYNAATHKLQDPKNSNIGTEYSNVNRAPECDVQPSGV